MPLLTPMKTTAAQPPALKRGNAAKNPSPAARSVASKRQGSEDQGGATRRDELQRVVQQGDQDAELGDAKHGNGQQIAAFEPGRPGRQDDG